MKLRASYLLCIGSLLLLQVLSGCRAGYVVKSAWFQAELLAGRVPLDQALENPEISPEQAERLVMVPEIKAFGETLGLLPTHNYDTVNLSWKRTIWNFSACEPLAFRPVTWWFPIVGKVPYLGFFRIEDAERYRLRYEGLGKDVWVRTAGAYSTLGWFRDPILPSMLGWRESRLAETVLHELAHSTLWIKGSVTFNENFASVVGEVAAEAWIIHRYGPESTQLREMQEESEDWGAYRGILHELYQDLDATYQNSTILEEDKKSQKAMLLGSLEERIVAAHLHQPTRYQEAARKGPWNNARLVQFKVYNAQREALDRLLIANNRDLRRFIAEVDQITRDARDPYRALNEAVGLVSPGVQEF